MELGGLVVADAQESETSSEGIGMLIAAGADVNARIRVHPWYMVYTDCGNANVSVPTTCHVTPSRE